MKKAVTCAQCGTKMRAGIKFCSKCGYSLRDAEAEALAAAAQAEEAAANFLTEEEVAALQAAENAPAVTEETGTTAEEAVAPATSRLSGAAQAAVEKQRAATEKELARIAAKASSGIARAEGDSATRRTTAESSVRLNDARRDRTVAGAELKASRRSSAAADKLSAMRIAEDKRNAKIGVATDRKHFRANATIDSRDAARAAREAKRAIDVRAFEGQVADLRQAGEHALAKKQEREALRTERVAIAGRDAEFRAEAKALRARAKALRNEEKKAGKYRRDEENGVVRERTAENRLYERRVAASKASSKQRAKADERIQAMRLSGEKKAARRVSAERKKVTKVLVREEGKITNRENDSLKRDAAVAALDNRVYAKRAAAEKKAASRLASDRMRATKALLREESKVTARGNDGIRKDAEEKAFENRVYAKQLAADKKVRKRRHSDINRAEAKKASVRARENKRLGSIEYRAARVNLTDEASEARRQANAAELEMRRRREAEKLTEKEVAAEKRLINRRAADQKKTSRTKLSLRDKETRALGRAEMRNARIAKTDEVNATRREADKINLHTDETARADRLYTKKLAADRRLIKTRAADNEKIQEADIRNDRMLQTVQMLEDSRALRVRTDDTKRALREQKKQDELYRRQKNSTDNISEREHRLEVKRIRANSAHDARVMDQKEKEQRKNFLLADRAEKEALRRAKKISRISGVPVSLVPALTGEGTPQTLLTTGGALENGAPALRDPDSLLANSYETRKEQYDAFEKRKKKDKNRLRYVEIGIRNDKKYFNTIYQNGEVMVAKRTVYLARVQSILAIVLMLVALVGSLLPMLSVTKLVGGVDNFYTYVLDDQSINPREEEKTAELRTIWTEQNKELTALEAQLEANAITQEAYDARLATINAKYAAQRASVAQKYAPEGYVSFESVLTTGQSDSSNVFGYVLSLPGKLGQIDVADLLNSVLAAMDDSSLVTNLGRWAVLLVLSVAILITPILILLNLVVAILRTIFCFRKKTVSITRVMKNLRASFACAGFILLPVLVLPAVKMATGFYLYFGAFAGAVVLNFVLNLFKKYEKCDRRFVTAVNVVGLIRTGLLVGLIFMLGSSGIFTLAKFGTPGSIAYYASVALAGISMLLAVLASRSLNKFGFEIVGYTKGATTTHWPMIACGAAAGIFAAVAIILAGNGTMMMALVATGLMAAMAVITLILNLVKRMIAKRNSLIDPIIDALGEGYPLK